MRHVSLIALVLFGLFGACRKPSLPSPGVEIEADESVEAPSPPQRRLFGYESGLCVNDGHAVECFWPDGRKVIRSPRSPEPRMAGLVEAAKRRHCWLRSDGVAFCHDIEDWIGKRRHSLREVARNVRSVEAAPYLLLADGSITVVPPKSDDDDDPEVLQTPLRIEAVKKLPPIERLAESDDATCALTKTGDVWCWSEPLFGFNENVEVAVLPHPAAVPNLHDVIDIAMMPWLTLCVRTRAGAILCSRSLGTSNDVCELRGKSHVRCGGSRISGQMAMGPLVEPSYDARRTFERLLEAVPGLGGADPAQTLALYQRDRYSDRESERRVYQGSFDEGGCAMLASGAVRCWERNLCAPKQPWRSAAVAGLPPKVARMVLGATDGYAITESGELFHWARRSEDSEARIGPHEDCATPTPPFEPKAERVALSAPVFDVFGSTAWYLRALGADAVDCATLVSGDMKCWARVRHNGPRVAVSIRHADTTLFPCPHNAEWNTPCDGLNPSAPDDGAE
ncbi:MAG: hypothetical protein FWD69_09400 [Polyangiaceae bacterium]|nr:hypothetical protein [Polyangiaceae bacterium]